MNKNNVWYQVNPHYLSKILDQQVIFRDLYELTSLPFFDLLKAYLPKIYDIGCTGIWMMPVYQRGEQNRKGFGSPYAVREYDLSPEWGTANQLQNLVLMSKECGFDFIGEYIPNHLAVDAPFLIDNPNSYYKNITGEMLFEQNWNDIVKLNHSAAEVQAFTSASLSWLFKNYSFDGFRLDVAHYPYYGIENSANGKAEESFWDKVFDTKLFNYRDKTWIAEVYDDKNKDLYGYSDHLRLLKKGMIVYDKKIHDILSCRLKYQPTNPTIQESLYRETYIQYQVATEAGYNLKKSSWPFLRIPSNHDDNPAIKIYGGLEQYLVAFTIQAFLPGNLMLYSGEEFGITVKTSVTGVNICDESGELCESEQIYLAETQQQGKIFKFIQKTLHLRKNEKAFQKGELLFLKLLSPENIESNSLSAYVRYIPESNDLILVAGNCNTEDDIKWGSVKFFYPTYEQPSYEFQWSEFLEYINPNVKLHGYRLKNLFTNEVSDRYEQDHSLWLGLKPLESQVFKVQFYS